MTTNTDDKKASRREWLSAELWPYETRTVEVDGYTIAYMDEGEGPTLLLVHDGMWSYVWGQLIGRLRPRFRVLTLDFPGSGLSPDTDRLASLEGDARLLEQFVTSIGLDRFTVVLHDLGGPVGMGLAVRRPELVDGLVLVNTFAWPPRSTSLKLMFGVMKSRPIRWFNTTTNLLPRMTSGRFGIGRHLDLAGRKAFLGGFDRPTARRRFHDLMGAALSETDYLATVEASLSPNLGEKPVLTMFGSNNDPFGFQARFRDYFEDVVEMTISRGNHFPMADDPAGVARRIGEWHDVKVSPPRS